MTRNRASEDDVGSIHSILAAHFLDVLQNGEEVVVTNKETGEVTKVRVKPSAAMLAQIRTFLKDNNITVMPGKSRPMVDLGVAFEGFSPPEDPAQPQQLN